MSEAGDHACACMHGCGKYLFSLLTLDYNGRHLNLTLVQYIMSSGDELETNPHENACSSQPYLHTRTTTLQATKSQLKSSSLKETLVIVSKEKCGEILAKVQETYLVIDSRSTA